MKKTTLHPVARPFFYNSKSTGDGSLSISSTMADRAYHTCTDPRQQTPGGSLQCPRIVMLRQRVHFFNCQDPLLLPHENNIPLSSCAHYTTVPT